MSNIGIPLNSHINTKDNFIIHQIDTQEKDALQKKNTLQFQSTLSPMYYKHENKVMTTSGHTFSISNTQLIDEKNQRYTVDNSLVVDKSYDLTKWHSGKVVDAVINSVTNHILAVYENSSSVDKVSFAADGTEVGCDTYTYESDDLYVKGKILKNVEPVFVLARIKANSVKITKGNSTVTLNLTVGSDLYAYTTNGYIFIGFDDKDVRKRFTFVFDSQFTLIRQFWGWGCIGDNGYVTGEPIPIAVTRWANTILLDNVYDQFGPAVSNVTHYFFPDDATDTYELDEEGTICYNFLENGIGYIKYQNPEAPSDADWIASNSVLKNDSSYNHSAEQNNFNYRTITKHCKR